jgi:hypothetical protein
MVMDVVNDDRGHAECQEFGFIGPAVGRLETLVEMLAHHPARRVRMANHKAAR